MKPYGGMTKTTVKQESHVRRCIRYVITVIIITIINIFITVASQADARNCCKAIIGVSCHMHVYVWAHTLIYTCKAPTHMYRKL
jgi:hypothetical protein